MFGTERTRAVRVLCLVLLAACASKCNIKAQAAQNAQKPHEAAPQIKTQEKPASFELDDSKGYVASFRYDPPDRPVMLVQATVNNSKPYTFVFDTAEQVPLVIAGWAQKEMKLPLAAKETPPGAPAADFQYTGECQVIVRGKTDAAGLPFHVDKAVVTDVPALDNWFRPRVAGIINPTIFPGITSRLDFDKRTLTFFGFKHPPLKPSGPYTNIPLLPAEENLPFRIDLPILGVGTIPFSIDTGSSDTVVYVLDDKKLVRLAENSEGTHFDNSGTYPAGTLMLPTFQVGELTVPLVALTVVSHAGASSMGMDLISCFRVTIDMDNKLVTFEPRKGFRYRRTGMTGIDLAEQSGKFTVHKIGTFDAASTAIAMNDRVISIDGEPVSDMTPMQARTRLNGYEGTSAKLVIEQASGKHVTVEIPRHSAYSTVAAGVLGMTFIKDPGKPARVLEVLTGSVADKAGVVPDDELLGYNDREVGSKTAEEITNEMLVGNGKPPHIDAIKIRRKKNGQVVTLHIKGA